MCLNRTELPEWNTEWNFHAVHVAMNYFVRENYWIYGRDFAE